MPWYFWFLCAVLFGWGVIDWYVRWRRRRRLLKDEAGESPKDW